MAVPALELHEALRSAADLVAEALECDKVDAFVFDEQDHSLHALGTSSTPMGDRQRALGLDVLSVANGGRAVEVFQTGASFIDGHADRDPQELRGISVDLGVHSSLNVALTVNGVRRGVLSAVSAQPEFFRNGDVPFLEMVAHWVGMLAHRAELAEQTRRAEAAAARVRAADEIVTVLAHDLRNHLHPLLIRLELVRRNIACQKPVNPSDLDVAVRSVHRLTRLTSDLLDLKRLDEGLFTLEVSAIDVAAIARETAAAFATTDVPVQVEGEPELVIIADGDRVRQALENLVGNATKYSPRGRAVKVRVSVLAQDERVNGIVDVIDEGPGIPPDRTATLFQRFTSSRDSKGLGLGLYLAHRITEAHGGQLSVESRPGAGSRFRLVLPFAASDG